MIVILAVRHERYRRRQCRAVTPLTALTAVVGLLVSWLAKPGGADGLFDFGHGSLVSDERWQR